jgi:NADPH:quinone reductase-like Zn-dependent oxidoreductase
MKAIVYTEYGSPDVLQLKEVEKPVPKDNEVLIKVHAVSVNRSDWEGLIGKPLYARLGGPRKPNGKIPGSDIAGRVEAAGSNAKRFQPGAEVFGLLGGYAGGFAEFACISEKALAPKPPGLSFDEAATIPQAGAIAVQGIRDSGQVQPGQKVLINGAGGGAGSFAVQLAKLYGAEVTGVDNTEKQNFMRSLGADHVIDYTRVDFTKNKNQHDLILDLVANRSVIAYGRALRPDGTYFFVGGSVATIFQILLLAPLIRGIGGKQIRLLLVQPNPQDMLYMTELFASGKVVPSIDRRYSMNEVPEALRYLGEGHVKGKIVINVSSD